MDFASRVNARNDFAKKEFTCKCGLKNTLSKWLIDARYEACSAEEDDDFESLSVDFTTICPECEERISFSVLYVPALVTVYQDCEPKEID